MSSLRFEEFLSKVTSKVKSKEAHEFIKKELNNHLKELSLSFQRRGASKEEAEDMAIQEMGNPFSIGENLNLLHKPKMDWVLIVLFVIIAGISFLPLVGGDPGMSAHNYNFVGRQIIWVSLAIFALVCSLLFDYRKLKNWWKLIYGSGLALILLTSLFSPQINGAKRWIALGNARIDTISICLLLFFLAWAGIFIRIHEFKGWKNLVLLFFLFWFPILLYLNLANLMSSFIYFFCIATMFAFSPVHKKIVIKATAVNVAMAVIFICTLTINFHNDYLRNRLLAYLNPYADPEGAGYMYIVVKDILSKAGWFGNGLYNDVNIQQPLPAAHTDFAFPYLVYSLGWVFGIILCLLLLIFITRISRNAFKTKDLYGKLLVIGGATLIAVPACWNILMGFRIVPIMGVSLPFISYGGSMLLFYSTIVGLILNVYRRKDIVEPTI